MAINTFAQYGLASTETTDTGFTGSVGTPSSRKSMPLAEIAYEIDFEFDGSSDVITLATSTGIATGDVTGVKATGTITFTGLPVANETITVNGAVYTFKASAATATEITIGADATETASNTASKIDANQSIVDAVNVLGVVTISAANTGEYGNAYTLAESASNTAVSAANLSGGVDKVVITGDGVDYLGNALPTASKMHGILVLTDTGSATVALGSVIKDTVTPNGGFQTWNSTGRTDLIGSLTITSAAANTTGKIVIRSSE